MPELTVVVLAGGRATRLPGKLALRVEGEPMLVRVCRRLASADRPMVLSVRDDVGPELRAALPWVTDIVTDERKDEGPLGGLACAAARVTTPLLFAAAADLPNLDEVAIESVLALYQRAANAVEPPQAIVPVHADGMREPLAALYETQPLLASARRVLRDGRRRVSEAIDMLRVLAYDIPAVEETRYANVNTAEDFQRIVSS
jgi:molybdopterin-guanine dinucleotide biosynthesis protein A